MRYLSGEEEKEAIEFIEHATEIAKKATCLRHKCGSVIVKDNNIIGRGFNSPPNNLETQRRCSANKDEIHKKITDKTCCVHAEQRAIMDAMKNNSNKLNGSTLYFMRIDEKGKMTKAGKPYCTICSKMALDCGVKEFVLWHDEGICVYDTEEYNKISYEYDD